MATKKTSKKVAAKAAKVLKDETSTPEEKSVAASALAQTEPEEISIEMVTLPKEDFQFLFDQLEWAFRAKPGIVPHLLRCREIYEEAMR